MTTHENIVRLIAMVSQVTAELTTMQTVLSEVLDAIVRESAARDEQATAKEPLHRVEKFKLLNSGVCPDCGSASFWPGPKAGLSENIRCVDCGSKFNIYPPFFAARI